MNILIVENGSLPLYKYNSDAEISYFEFLDPGGIYRNFVLGGAISTGGEFMLDDKVSIFVRAYFDSNITSVENENYEIVLNEGAFKIFNNPFVTLRSKYNMAAGLSFGLVFKIRELKNNN